MFYICDKNEQGLYGVKDSEDGVVEYYDYKTLGKLIKHFHIDIKGVKIYDNTIKISIVDSTIVKSGFCSEFKGLYENTLRSEFIDNFPNLSNLVQVARFLSGKFIYSEDIVDLDGWDCVGFENLPFVLNSAYRFSIYTNPEFTVECMDNDYKIRKIVSNGFGVDISLNGNILEHIDGSWESWKDDIKSSDCYKSLCDKEKPIIPLEKMTINDFDNTVYPLYKLIYDTINKILCANFNVSDVEYLDGYDCVGIDTKRKTNKGKINISVFSNGLMDYNKTGNIEKDIGVDFISDTSFDIKIPDVISNFVTLAGNNHIHVEIPYNRYEAGLNATYIIVSLLDLNVKEE